MTIIGIRSLLTEPFLSFDQLVYGMFSKESDRNGEVSTVSLSSCPLNLKLCSCFFPTVLVPVPKISLI